MGPQGPDGVGAVIVVDANGQRVGVLNTISDIRVTAGEVTSLVLVDRSGFQANSTFGTFYYFTPDCSDAPYGASSGSGFFPLGRVANDLLWLGLPTAPSKDLAAGAIVFVRNNVGTGACSASTVSFAMKLYLLQSYAIPTFVPPFRIE